MEIFWIIDFLINLCLFILFKILFIKLFICIYLYNDKFEVLVIKLLSEDCYFVVLIKFDREFVYFIGENINIDCFFF